MAADPPLVTVCIDDTDRPGDRSTARLALGILEVLGGRYRCHSLTIHPHLSAPGLTWEEKGNHSACMRFVDEPGLNLDDLVHEVHCLVLEDWREGSHPGLCAGREIPVEVQEFAQRSRLQKLTIQQAQTVAARCGLVLEGLGGTGRGVIGALAGAGMAAAGGPGTYLQLGPKPSELSGLISPRKLGRLGVERFLDATTGQDVEVRPLWVYRKLHPAMVEGEPVVYVQTTDSGALAFVELDPV